MNLEQPIKGGCQQGNPQCNSEAGGENMLTSKSHEKKNFGKAGFVGIHKGFI